MLIAVLPADLYAIDPESGVNLTVQYATKHIVDSLNRLSLHGVALTPGTPEEDEPCNIQKAIAILRMYLRLVFCITMNLGPSRSILSKMSASPNFATIR